MNQTEYFWSGEFGDEYTSRNKVDWRARIPFWKTMVVDTGARSFFELGCNAGWNLSAISRVDPQARVMGCDVNVNAVTQGIHAGLNINVDNHIGIQPAEFIFTAGVLIHIEPGKVLGVMESIISQSYDYVLAVEYESLNEPVEEVEYRGHSGKLWRRRYGEIYQRMGLDLVRYFQSAPGFDNCAAWLLRKK